MGKEFKAKGWSYGMMSNSSMQNQGVMMNNVGVYGDYKELHNVKAERHMRTADLKHELRV